MSANRKNSGRQSNLFSYFQKTPKREEPSKVVANEATDERENMPDENERASKSSPQRNANITPLAKRGKEQVENKLESTPTATPIILESDDENSRGIGFLSCASSSSAPPTKRRRVILSSDSEGETNGKKFNENETPIRSKKNKNETPIRSKKMGNEGKRFNQKEDKNEEKEDVDMELGENEKQSKSTEKVKATKIFGKSKSGKGFKLCESTASFIDSFSFDSKTVENIEGKQKDEKKSKKLSKKELAKIDESSGERFPHLDFWHLKPENIKDANGKRPSDANYDPKTLYVPGDFLKTQTPAHQQWWKLKTKYFDTVLFFKVGKFYELFHMDAVIGVENLGLAYMRGKFAHAGFPEIAYGRFADQLVNRGYKVARIEQTEKPEQLAERQKTQMSSQREKVVKREICRVTTLGTKTYGILDGMDSREMVGTMEPNPSYLMALTEKKEEMGSPTRYGVCFVDCSVGRFLVSEFVDDHSQSNLRTLLAHNYPAQLIYEKGAISAATNSILTTMLGNVKKEAVLAKKQFQTAEKTLEMLCRDNYLGTNYEEWPEILKGMLIDCSATIPHPEPTKKLSLSALGAVLWYLEECLIDVETVSMKKFEEYIPPSIQSGESAILRKYMVLDGVSLLNLHILPALSLSNFGQQKRSGPVDKSISSFSLLNTINRCQTAFGKRLLRQWVSAPNCDRETLLGRQNALKWMLGEGMRGNVMKWAEMMRKVPDLERMFQRVHTIGLKYRADPKGGHPDSRAQMFDAEKYNKRKIRDLLIILDGIEQIEKLVKLFNQINDEAEEKAPKLLEKCLGIKIGKMSKDLEYFKKAFDRESALKKGVIIPHGGVDKEYDDASREVEERKAKLEEFLGQMKKMLKCSAIKYIGSGRNQYQMEIPEANCRNLPAEFEKTSQRKGFKRYSSPELQKLIKKLGEAENRQLEISSEVTRRVFADFDERKNKWAQIVQQIAVFDCLLSLALYAQHSSQKMCFPEFVFDSYEPFLEIDRGYYPSLVDLKTKNGAVLDFIPNSCHLGGTAQLPPTMLLTGPNMGGKSTYMRQIASLCVLAQIGSMVPAESMRLSPIDRIFCRIGASDRLAMGQSTFYVELAETNRIIQQATPHSLVIIDELGRGTSTHDGTAIAAAVLKHISNKIRCRTIFSTHYHSLCKFISSREDGIQFAHMACIVENANVEDPTMESVTFLYTLTEGICNKSYGFYTAKMAGLDVEVVRKAFAASKMLMEKSGMGKGV